MTTFFNDKDNSFNLEAEYKKLHSASKSLTLSKQFSFLKYCKNIEAINDINNLKLVLKESLSLNQNRDNFFNNELSSNQAISLESQFKNMRKRFKSFEMIDKCKNINLIKFFLKESLLKQHLKEQHYLEYFKQNKDED